MLHVEGWEDGAKAPFKDVDTLEGRKLGSQVVRFGTRHTKPRSPQEKIGTFFKT